MANGNGYSAGNLEFSVQQISNATISSLDTLIAKLKTVSSLLGSTSSISKTLSTAAGRSSGSGASFNTKETNKQLKISSFKLSEILNKVYFIRNYTKQMFRSVVEMVERAVDYTETLNLWQVAMRGNTEQAEEFIKTMNKGYGIATQTLMEYQAIFKNMLSSLGGISSDTSYALSEYLTQMALDYASLYNVSIEKAMTTFQSVLSGQVRPIRSIAGYDITETTIYQLYQQLGGTKTMRQLSQTEKRLLRIYAVFQQMESSGAVGDLGKTMGSTANQMRVFTESTKELYTWFGMLLESVIKPVLPWLNAITITLTNIIKAILQMKGIKPQEFGVVESVQELNAELDETQGKLLSFDRFEALNSAEGENNLLGIDESLLAGLSKYESVLGNISGEAQELAEKWTDWWVDADTGELTEQAQELLDTLKNIGIVLGSLIGLNLITKIGKLLFGIKNISSALSLVGFAISAINILEIIDNWKDWSTAGKAMSGVILGLTVAFATLAVAVFGATKQWGKALAIGGVILATGTSVALGVGNNLSQFKNGGQVEDGIFTMNKGEVMGTFDDGTSIVANNQQIISGIQQGVYSAVVSAMKQSGNGGVGDVYLDGRKVGQTTARYSHQENVRTGLVKATR